MTDSELFIMSTALGMDLFSVSVPIGMTGVNLRLALRASLLFAVFHIVMLLSGYYFGGVMGSWLSALATAVDSPLLQTEDVAGIIGGLVLLVVGLLMLRESVESDEAENHADARMLRGTALLMLALSVSVDALAAGLSFGMMELDLFRLNIILGTVIFIISMTGLTIGRRVGRCLGIYAARCGAVALILLSIRLLYVLVNR